MINKLQRIRDKQLHKDRNYRGSRGYYPTPKTGTFAKTLNDFSKENRSNSAIPKHLDKFDNYETKVNLNALSKMI